MTVERVGWEGGPEATRWQGGAAWWHKAGMVVVQVADGFEWHDGGDSGAEATVEAAMLAAEASTLRQMVDGLRAMGYDVSALEAQARERRVEVAGARLVRRCARGRVMDAVSVWVEHLREQAVVAQRQASRASWISLRARANLPGKDDPSAAYVIHRIRIGDDAAHRAGIIAREAYRQWAAAVEAAPYAKHGRMAGNATTYSGMGQCLMALERNEP